LSAILAADVVGYSRLMGLDEAGTAHMLREHRLAIDALVAKHGGRIVKTTGDGLLLEFPSVVDAVECSVSMQAVMTERNRDVPPDRRMLYRIGINLGDILIEGDDILGDGVNIAARLEGIAEPGGICISASTYDQVRGKVSVEFTDLGEQTLKNIARPVRAYAVLLDGLVSGAHQDRTAPTPVSAPHLSLLVLPFANISGDPEQDYFVDGVTESLTTDLSRIAGSFVIARNTAFTYKGKAVDLRQVGRDLNVRYVLEGSVQRGGSRLRVNVQLIDAQNGQHLWAERFDKPLADLFDMQDEIVAHLASQLGTRLVEVEARRAERSPNPDSIELYFRAVAWLNRGITSENMAQAEAFFERALALDANNVDALIGTAWVGMSVAASFLADDRAARFAAAEATAIKTLSLAPNHAFAHLVLGAIYTTNDRAAEGIAELEHALVLDRNLAYAHMMIGTGKTALGRAEEAEGHIGEALRLSPRDVMAHHWMSSIGTAKLHLAKVDEAVVWFRRAIEANRNYAFTHFSLAAALAQLRRIDEARAATQAGLVLEPGFTIGRLRAGARSNNPTYLAGRERIYEGMRRAGIPE
jgi:TolB-like protein/Tfp pilus assembly protein PilF